MVQVPTLAPTAEATGLRTLQEACPQLPSVRPSCRVALAVASAFPWWDLALVPEQPPSPARPPRESTLQGSINR